MFVNLIGISNHLSRVSVCVYVKMAVQEVGWREKKRERETELVLHHLTFSLLLSLWCFILFLWDPFSIDCNYFEVLSSHL